MLPRTSLRGVNEDSFGKTPRDFALQLGLGDDSAVVKALVAAGGLFASELPWASNRPNRLRRGW